MTSPAPFHFRADIVETKEGINKHAVVDVLNIRR